MNAIRRLLSTILLGAVLLAAPYLVRATLNEYRPSHYQPPATGLPDLASTPEPTAASQPAGQDALVSVSELKAGPVVVDLAHMNQVSPVQFEPLAAQLARRGISLRFWMNKINTSETQTLMDLPDQSKDLEGLLQDATGLLIVSPVFLWKPTEVAVAEKFVADGGRLLLISDPDLPEAPDYFVHDINNLGQPFGIVFNDDYLYDSSHNDRNYTHVFGSGFQDQAATVLKGKTVAFYGARSLSGPVTAEVRTGDTTLSSLRSGMTGFTTVAMGGQAANGTAGRVLAMGDFDVLTEPYVGRYDNKALLEFVANFLADAHRTQMLTSFPAYLGKQVTLVFESEVAVDSQVLAQAGALQQDLERSGRVMSLASAAGSGLTGILTMTTEAATPVLASTPDATPAAQTDLIYVGSFQSAEHETTLLASAGIHPVKPAAMPKAVSSTETTDKVPDSHTLMALPVTPTATVKAAKPQVTPTSTLSPTLAATAQPTATLVLETDFGPRLSVDGTVLILRQPRPRGGWVTAVLGNDAGAISAGLNRLVARSFNDCTTGVNLVICPYVVSETPTESATATPAATATPEAAENTTNPPATPTPAEPAPAAPQSSAPVLLIDDNQLAGADEPSEARLYQETLETIGYTPVLWSTADRGAPKLADLTPYRWVIWSDGAYNESTLKEDVVAVLSKYAEAGGSLTMGGRHFPPGDGQKAASAIADVVKTDEIPDLVIGLQAEPVSLAGGLPPVVPLAPQSGTDWMVVLRRGPQSADADAPLMLATRRDAANKQARLILIGMALNWLPSDYAAQLVVNMAFWMTAS